MSRDWYITPEQYRWFMDTLIDASIKYSGLLEIETTLSPFDGIYIADKIAKDKEEFIKMLELVKAQGGCGRKIISIYPDGTVYPCQFVDFMTLGNVRVDNLKEILNPRHEALRYFSHTEEYLKEGRCASCPFNIICKGGDRIRAYYLGGSLYASDPQCHLDIEGIYERWFSE
jgi:radical SAM protein with 4Fe4S-binding SPASM domain